MAAAAAAFVLLHQPLLAAPLALVAFLTPASLRMARQWERAVVLRAGRLQGTRGPGLFVIIPVVDSVAGMVDLRIQTTPIATEQTLTRDTTPVDVDAIVFWKVADPERAITVLMDYVGSVSLVAQTSLREMIGATDLSTLLEDRKHIDTVLRDSIAAKIADWGITVQGVEIRDVMLPRSLQDAMSRQAQAGRERMARVTLAAAEREVATELEEAARTYDRSPTAMQILQINRIYEMNKDRGATILLPTSMADSMARMVAPSVAIMAAQASASSPARPVTARPIGARTGASGLNEVSLTRIVLARRPVGAPVAEDFRIERVPLPRPQPGEVLVRVLYLSLDPYMRGRMSDAKSYAAPLAIGDVMVGETVAEVVQGAAGFETGDIVRCQAGWQSHAVLHADSLHRVDAEAAPVSTALGVLGMPGFSGWVGLDRIGQPKPGETLVVAAATGPVGATVGQVARLRGARSVGIAGGARKCAVLIEQFGFAAAIDHRAPDFATRLAEACPDGIDVYFENVGGAVFEAVLPLLNRFARVPVCGVVATYNNPDPAPGPDRVPILMGAILRRSLTVRGFINSNFIDRYDAFYAEMSAWVRSGQVRTLEDVVDGLEHAPAAFIGMLEGRNFGKLLVRP